MGLRDMLNRILGRDSEQEPSRHDPLKEEVVRRQNELAKKLLERSLTLSQLQAEVRFIAQRQAQGK